MIKNPVTIVIEKEGVDRAKMFEASLAVLNKDTNVLLGMFFEFLTDRKDINEKEFLSMMKLLIEEEKDYESLDKLLFMLAKNIAEQNNYNMDGVIIALAKTAKEL